jgi:pimeloyl-ACP methyl ester carboxylesterase
MAPEHADILEVPGARLHYEVRGSGPAVLLIAGSNGDAGLFDGIADVLADEYTVISYDRRGFSRSPLTEPFGEEWSKTHTDDARRLLEAVAAGPGRVFGSSAGAVIGLDLVTRYPTLVTGLIAHEPPMADVLPDAAEWREFFTGVYDVYRRDGVGPAMGRFMSGIGLDTVQRPVDPDPGLVGRIPGNLDFFLAHEVRQAPGYRPDLAALDAHKSQIVLAGGRDSRDHFPYRPAATLAARWGKQVMPFPGDHVGYWAQPAEFAATLADALRDARGPGEA